VSNHSDNGHKSGKKIIIYQQELQALINV